MTTTSAPVKPPFAAEPFIAACRGDGLGGRVGAMLNALWLARRLGLGFRFAWKPLRSGNPDSWIPAPKAVFEAGFLHACHRPLSDVMVAQVWRTTDLTRSAVAAAFENPSCRGIIFNLIGNDLRLDGVHATAAELRDAWQLIGWSGRLRELESQARAVMPAGSVALHMRRGDIVYGQSRRLHWPGKFRPFAWLRRAVEGLCDRGTSVVVFGDSAAAVDNLCDGLPVLRADRLRPGKVTGFEAAFFELCALSAAERIIGSRSNYGRVASMIGGTEITQVEEIIPAEQLVPLVLEDLAARPGRYDRFERAQELLWLSMKHPEHLAPGQAQAFLEEASRLDPGNDLPTVLLAQHRLRAGDHTAAERLFAQAAEQAFAALGRVTPSLYTDGGGTWALPGVLSGLPAADRERLPYTNAYAAELAGANEPDRLDWTERATRDAPGSDLLLARHAQAVVDAGNAAGAAAALALVEKRLHRPDVPVVLWTLRAALRRVCGIPCVASSAVSSSLATAAVHDLALRNLIFRLRPVPIVSEIVRIGSGADGGYVMPDDFTGVCAVISPGVGRETTFDHAMAERGIPVFMADGSVAGPPVPHDRFAFDRRYVGLCDNETTVRLDTLVSRAPDDGDLILQMDIEGAEYHALLDASPETLGRFRVMLIEFHALGRLLDPAESDLLFATFERLLETHDVVHIHPNNAGSLKVVREIEVPVLMEFTFLRRDRVTVDPGRRLQFPHPLDSDNVPGRPSLPLPTIWHPDRRQPADGVPHEHSVQDASEPAGTA